jgi:protein TonB
MEPKKHPSKDVHRFSKHFFLIGLCISIMLAITAFEWRTEKKKIIADPFVFEDPPMALYPVPVTYQENKPSPQPIKVKPIIFDPTKITEIENIGKAEPTETPFDEPVEISTYPGNETDIEASVDTFIFVENMPVPEGGYEAFYKLLSKNMKYPSKAKSRNAEGRVFVEFVVNKEGAPVNMKVLRGIGHGCDEEAMRVLSLAKWNPGKQRGRQVPVKMVMPIYFKLE